MTDKNGYKSVDYSRLSPILLQGIKEQQVLLEDYEKRIDELQRENQEKNVLLKSLAERIVKLEKIQ